MVTRKSKRGGPSCRLALEGPEVDINTLDGKVDEGHYPDEISKRILSQIQRTRLSPEENAKLKDEATWESVQRDAYSVGRDVGKEEGKKLGIDEGKKLGIDEGKKLGLQQAILDLCEAYGITITAEQKTALASFPVTELETVRQAIKTGKTWPARG